VATSAQRAWARGVVEATSLARKLVPPPPPDGDEPSAPLDDLAPPRAPGRPPTLVIRPARDVVVPPIAGMRDPAQRARILHALANHELQAIELFAWGVLQFAALPPAFHGGLCAIAAEEQRHFGLYQARLATLGVAFGDLPVTGHFWRNLDVLSTPLGFVCAMGLTFENANLDFAGDYAAAARAIGDEATAAAIDLVHHDEIGHVRFAWTWLARLAPGRDPWEVYLAHARPPLGPHRARGPRLDVEARVRAGLSPAFIEHLAQAEAKRPGGGPRT
jgi:uncharacterized ferritin-like protein (DUF455 family)